MEINIILKFIINNKLSKYLPDFMNDKL